MPIKITNEEFINRAKKIHGDLYSYDLCFYENAKIKVKIICKKHGIFEITPNSHISICRSGCYNCGLEKTASKKRKNRFQNLVYEMTNVHEGMYDYSLITIDNYLGMNYKIPVICKKHGIFYVKPRKHIDSKSGCRCCANESFYIDDFMDRAKKIHIFYDYDYTDTVYRGMDSNLSIVCKKHGPFNIRARYFLHKGKGCKKCRLSDNNKSIKEIEWLNSIGIATKFRNILFNFSGKYYNVDGIDLDKKIVYEFYGDFFHGNPDVYNQNDINPLLKETYGSLYDKTINREKWIENSGYTIVKVWESDFDKNK